MEFSSVELLLLMKVNVDFTKCEMELPEKLFMSERIINEKNIVSLINNSFNLS